MDEVVANVPKSISFSLLDVLLVLLLIFMATAPSLPTWKSTYGGGISRERSVMARRSTGHY
ncbi:hypothetical protein KCP74_22795 [Salmonella enterica subsp. enterica]|nr:hypothetical protein KCP74_22795 [Salmonella enterica subsp. enterica]